MRYSRRRGPTANFECALGYQLITGMSITRFWDEGELLISGMASYNQAAGATSQFGLAIVLDAVTVLPQTPPTQTVLLGQTASLALKILQPIAQGQHTIQLWATGLAAAGDVIFAQSAELIVIQLPLWDATTDILTL